MTLLSQEASRKKQLGQYFTGERVGRLLAALADAKTARRIIDPMVGSADLLVSCIDEGATTAQLVGLELDPLALERAKAALEGVPGANLILGDAFSVPLPAGQFDLVITNPPYIRYQSKGDVDGVSVPSGEAVRVGLVRAITTRTELPEDVRALLLRAARTYPGTADIAVPAWLLSASLVREGGVLAVVAPQAWLSRNYAQAVRELLDDAFDVEVIVEDGDASWFDDAQVRTQLVIARRRTLGPRSSSHSVVLARATRELEVDGFLRGALGSEQAVAAALRAVGSTDSVAVTTGLTAHIEHDRSMAAGGHAGHVPARIAAGLGVVASTVATRTLESYGWRAGQGLRTGANDFFYVSDAGGAPHPARRWGLSTLAIPSDCLIPAIRRQTDLQGKLDITDATPLSSWVVNFRGWAAAQDANLVRDEMRVLPPAISKWIATVAQTPLTDAADAKLFPELAAVATNARTRSGKSHGFWYQLPPLAPRHRPTLFMPRVCGGRPLAYANSAGAVVDANFSTFWPVDAEALPADALLALLNSSWTWANLEASCTVLGGGALKVEATDLRRLPLPDLQLDDIAALVELGRELRWGLDEKVLTSIDQVIVTSLVPAARAKKQSAEVRELAERSLRHRSRR